MSKVHELRKLYQELELNIPEQRELLTKLKNCQASEDEVNELLDKIAIHSNSGKKLNEIKDFENELVSEMNRHIDELVNMELESTNVAHIEDEEENAKAYAAMKIRYKVIVEKAEETYEALKEAYFQVVDFAQYNDRLYDAKQDLLHLE